MDEELSTLPVGETGRVLDRLLLLQQIFGTQQVRQVLHDTGCCDCRRCRLSREVLFWLVLAMGLFLFTDLPYRQLFKVCRRLWPGENTPHRSSLCLARQRLGLAPLRCLFQRVVRLLTTPQTPGAFYHGWRLMASSRLLLPVQQPLSDGSYLSQLYRCDGDRVKDRNGQGVRVIRYTLNDPQRVGHGQEHVLLTTLLEATLYPAVELVVLYHERWEIELVFDEQKTHQHGWRATKPADLRSQTPAGVLQELYALSLGHFVVRSLMVESASRQGLDADRLSFVGCLQILRCRMAECPPVESLSF
jgi:hypothetical protein